MHHRDLDGFLGAGGVVQQNGPVAGSVHLHQLGVVAHLDAVVGGDAPQDLTPGRLAEHRRRGQRQDDPHVTEHPLPPPPVGGEIGDLLRRPGALDRAGRHGEQRRSRSGLPDEPPGRGREVVAVVAGDPIAAEGIGQARHRVEVQLQARRQHQELIRQGRPVGQGDAGGLRIDGGCRLPDPGHARRHDAGLGPRRAFLLRESGTDQRPQRLVVVLLGRLDHGDVGDPGTPQPGGHGDAGGAATDDDDLVMAGSRC
nr:hypothetical protein [Actinoplanes durhamensis]